MWIPDWFADIKVVIFDMDGTLYQEDSYMDRYIRYMLEGTDWSDEADQAVAEARRVLAGASPVRFGHFYHKTDRIVLAHEDGTFTGGWTWEGNALSRRHFADAYGSLSAIDERLHYIGDPWGVALALRHHYGLPEEKAAAAFRRVREEMVVDPHRFDRDTALFRSILELDAVERKVLMTNTYEQSGRDFLRYMQIDNLFDEVICGADKPNGMNSYLDKAAAQGIRPHEVLSIGDNPWNDLLPVQERGGRTCFISPYPSDDAKAWDVRLHRLDELTELLNVLQSVRSAARSAI